MNPYPRDFRPGVYKYKSTSRGSKPTKSDLRRTIVVGFPGSSMPSFNLVPEVDREALIDYVVYLSVRGEVERRMLDAVAQDGWDIDGKKLAEEIASNAAGEGSPDFQRVRNIVRDVVGGWIKAEQNIVPVTPPSTAVPPADLATATPNPDPESVSRGAELFRGPIANCAACHGANGTANVTTLDYDDWTKEWSTRAGVNPRDSVAIKPFLKAGVLPPQIVLPRNLSFGVFRGGGEPDQIYRRIKLGIEGTPMPAVAMASQGNQVGLTEEQLWDLVHYVQQLPRLQRP